jgi:hypothetical protein
MRELELELGPTASLLRRLAQTFLFRSAVWGISDRLADPQGRRSMLNSDASLAGGAYIALDAMCADPEAGSHGQGFSDRGPLHLGTPLRALKLGC